MKIISFDIGIKNMAYCIFSHHTESPFEIHDWNVLNLMDQEEPSVYCNCAIASSKGLSKGIKSQPKINSFIRDIATVETAAAAAPIMPPKICCKIAKYRKGSQTFCDKHAKKQTEWKMFESRFSEKKIKKMKLEELTAIMTELSIDNNRVKKKAEMIQCIMQTVGDTFLEPITQKKSKSASDTDLIVIGKNMKLLLDQVLKNHTDITHIIIENQISPIANRMKTVQGMLAQYFIMTFDNPIIEIISSANKLKGFVKPTVEKRPSPSVESSKDGSEEKTQGQKYKEHKKDGVYYSKLILENNPKLSSSSSSSASASSSAIQWLSVLDTKKKDDLADCFLQGLWYLKNNQLINIDSHYHIQ